MARLTEDSRYVEAVWISHLHKAADEISERLASEAAEKFKTELKAKLVASMAVFLEQTMSMERMGRSQDFVGRRVSNYKPRTRGAQDVSGLRWPLPDTDEYRALDGRLYEDVSQDVLNRECPPDRPPMNGAAASAYVRSIQWPSQSAAAMCVGG